MKAFKVLCPLLGLIFMFTACRPDQVWIRNLETPAPLETTSSSPSRITLRWGSVKGAVKYAVYGEYIDEYDYHYGSYYNEGVYTNYNYPGESERIATTGDCEYTFEGRFEGEDDEWCCFYVRAIDAKGNMSYAGYTVCDW